MFNLYTVLNAFLSERELKTQLHWTFMNRRLWSVCDYNESQIGAADLLMQKECMKGDFLPLNRLAREQETSRSKEFCWLLITSIGEMLPDFKILSGMVLEIPVFIWAAGIEVSLQINIHEKSSDQGKVNKPYDNIAFAAIPLETFGPCRPGGSCEAVSSAHSRWIVQLNCNRLIWLSMWRQPACS